jgi:hypothetical protein
MYVREGETRREAERQGERNVETKREKQWGDVYFKKRQTKTERQSLVDSLVFLCLAVTSASKRIVTSGAP